MPFDFYNFMHEKDAHNIIKLKADRPHPRDYPPMPPDYRHIDITVQTGELGQTYPQTHKRTDVRYQVHYLPRFAVDKKQRES